MSISDEVDLRVLVGTKEAAKQLDCTAPTVRSMVRRKVLPCVRIPGSRALRFRPSTLLELARKFEAPAIVSVKEG